MEQADLAGLRRHDRIELLRRPDPSPRFRRGTYLDGAAHPGERVPVPVRTFLVPARAIRAADLYVAGPVSRGQVEPAADRLYLPQLPLWAGVRRTGDGE